MKILNTTAVALFVTLGFKIATKWDAVKLAEKLAELHKHIDPATELPDADQQALLTAVMEAGKAGTAFEIETDPNAPAAAAPTGKGKKGKAPKDEPAAAAPTGKTPEQIAKEKADKDAAKAKEKADKDAKAKADKEAAAAKKREEKEVAAKAAADKKAAEKTNKKTARYYAGQIIAETGIKHGSEVTDAMVARMVLLTGSDSVSDAKATLAGSVHVITGYLATLAAK